MGERTDRGRPLIFLSAIFLLFLPAAEPRWDTERSRTRWQQVLRLDASRRYHPAPMRVSILLEAALRCRTIHCPC